MGVPVVTLLGRHFVDRVASSIVTHAGFPELVTKDKKSYVNLAKKLAQDVSALNRMRLSMRDQLHDSSLCDGEGYANEIESALRDMWAQWCRKNITTSGL